MNLEEQLIDFIYLFFSAPYTYIGLLFIIVLGTFVSEDLLCVLIGLMVASDKINYVPAVLLCMTGVFIGDLILFYCGRYFGRPLLAHKPFSWLIRPRYIIRIEKWFTKYSMFALFVCRFIPGTRLPVYFSAGMLNISFLKFILSFLFSAIIWFPLIILFTSYLGYSVFDVLSNS